MDMVDLLAQDGIVANLKASSKKQALQELSQQAAVLTGLHVRTIFDVLLQREKLGTTGIGRGIAIPHGKMQELERLHGIFARLPKPVDFDAIDEQPVDLIFLLLAPESAGADHLKALAQDLAPAARRCDLCQTAGRRRPGSAVRPAYGSHRSACRLNGPIS